MDSRAGLNVVTKKFLFIPVPEPLHYSPLLVITYSENSSSSHANILLLTIQDTAKVEGVKHL
jgi:hypothetical protein